MSYTSKFTGTEIDSLLNSISSINATKTILFEGQLGGTDAYATLSDSIFNYDFISVEAQIIDNTGSQGAAASVLISVDEIEDFNDRGFSIFTSADPSKHWYRVSFTFTDGNVIHLAKSNVSSSLWSNPHIYKVVGIKFAQSSLAGGSASNPIGSILPIMGTEAPQDYLVCDGRELQISEYKELADYFEKQFGDNGYFGGDGIKTFKLPDLRNEFLRGFGDRTEEVGIHQDGTLHLDVVVGTTGGIVAMSQSGISDKATNYDETNEAIERVQYSSTTGSSKITRFNKYTSRPTNVAVLFCIKYTETKTQHTATTREYGCYNIEKPVNTSDNAEFPITALEENIGINGNGRIVLKANKAYLVKITCRQITFTGVGLAAIKLVKSDNTEIARLINLYPVTHSATVTGDGIERIVKFTEDTEVKLTVQEWTSVRDVYDLTLTIIEI